MIRDSVQSSAGLLKVHIFRCFQKISLILCNSDIIFRIMYIIKLQSSCGALVTLQMPIADGRIDRQTYFLSQSVPI